MPTKDKIIIDGQEMTIGIIGRGMNQNKMLWSSYLFEKMIQESMSVIYYRDCSAFNPVTIRFGKTLREYLDTSPCTTSFLYILRTNESFKKIETDREITVAMLTHIQDYAVIEECNQVIQHTLKATKYGALYLNSYISKNQIVN